MVSGAPKTSGNYFISELFALSIVLVNRKMAIPLGWSFFCKNSFYAMDLNLFDFHLNRFSFGETVEEAIRK
jgi:hypothetical protein